MKLHFTAVGQNLPFAPLPVILFLGCLICTGSAQDSETGASISGTAFHDSNGNGVKDKFESGPAGIRINLVDANLRDPIATTSTDIYGDYTFTGIPAGEYYISFAGRSRSQVIRVTPVAEQSIKGSKVPVGTSKNPILSGKNPALSGKNVIVGGKNPVYSGKNYGFGDGKSIPAYPAEPYVATPAENITGINILLPSGTGNLVRPTIGRTFLNPTQLNPRNVPSTVRPPGRFVPPISVNPQDPPLGDGGSISPFDPGEPGSQIENVKDALGRENEKGEPLGLSSGYWKNHTDEWEDVPLADVFPNFATLFADGTTLLDALKLGGGGANALARQAAAAYLNASSSTLSYPFSVQNIQSSVEAVWDDVPDGNAGGNGNNGNRPPASGNNGNGGAPAGGNGNNGGGNGA